LENVAVCHWTAPFPDARPADIVIEAFGCGLPQPYVAAMAERSPCSLWITLEYLSAEPWVRNHHGLASPPPRWPIPRYFFFPGFDVGTGGLLRERDLLSRRDAFGDAERREFWSSMGFEPPAKECCKVSLFAYENPRTNDLFAAWSQCHAPIIAAIPEGTSTASVQTFFEVPSIAAGMRLRRGSLEVRIVPFLPQPRYDELLWACDCNFVRGEDSFIRAQWAARPFIWQIYRQAQGAHQRKLEAFLDRYCDDLPSHPAEALRQLWRAWNYEGATPVRINDAWEAFWAERAALNKRAATWAERLASGSELAAELAQFCTDKLKY